MSGKTYICYSGGEGRVVEKKSEFIASISPVHDEQDAIAFIESIRKKYYDARHNCYAYIIGKDADRVKYSDDGEPSQTAGLPMYNILKETGIRNICVVVTRYFGGTLLGTGGLVKAYSDSTKMVLDGIKTQVLISKTSFSLQIPYDMYETVKRTLSAFEAETVSEVFETDIKITANVASEAFEDLNKKITDLSCGKIALTKIV